jgi:cobalt-zinc-cadmium efflux system protein
MSDHGHDHSHRAQSRRALGIVLGLTAAYTVCEIVGGWLTGSLALLADAGHMLGDTAALALALVAAWLAGRPATPERSFGYRRAEILAALVNGVALAVIAIWVFIEAVRRLDNPKEILGGWMLVVALVGLVVNAVAAAILARADRGNLNVQAALRHVFADLAGSVGVAVAALVVLATGWDRADPVASMAIGVLILASSWSIVRDAVSILLEATPAGIDADEVGRRMASMEGVVEVHDLHIWTITSGFPTLSAHVLVRRGDDCHQRRRELEQLLSREFDLEHTTLQVEHAGEQSGLQIEPLRRRER